MVSCSVFVRATRWQAGTRMRCLVLSSRRTMMRSFGRFSRISSCGTRGISLGMSSGFCSAGHWIMGFGGRVVEVVCNGCVNVLLHRSSRDGEGPSSVSSLDVGSSGVCCRLAFLNIHKETQDAWHQQQQHKNSSSLDEEDTNISNNVLSYHPFNQQKRTETNVPQIRVTTPQYHRSTMNYSPPTQPLQRKQSQHFHHTIWTPIQRRFPTLQLSPSTKHKHTFTSPLQPPFNPIVQVHQHPVTHNPLMVTDGLAGLHCQQISYPNTIHAPIAMTARKRPPTHHPETNSSCTDELCSRIRPHPPTKSQHKISWFTRIQQYFYKISHDTQTQTQPAMITHSPQTFHSVFLPENNTTYPYVPLNPTASSFFPLKQPFLQSPTNPKYHPSKTRPSRTLYTPPSHTHYTRPPSVANIQTHKNKKPHRQHKGHNHHGQRGHKHTAKEPHVQRRKMHTDTIQTHCQKSHQNKFNKMKTKPDVSAVTRPLTTLRESEDHGVCLYTVTRRYGRRHDTGRGSRRWRS
jgi:hypothetical protein